MGAESSQRNAAALVAQISNLAYRRFASGKALKTLTSFKHAVALQNEILRYSRLKTCATRTFPTRFSIDSGFIVFVRLMVSRRVAGCAILKTETARANG